MKSCLPTRRCAAAMHDAASSLLGTRQARPRSSARSAPAIDDAVEIMALRWPRSAHRNPSATISAASTPTGCGRRWALSPSRSLSARTCFARSRCATCPSAWTPASVRPAPLTRDRLARHRRDRAFERALHRRRRVLHLPAGKGCAVIFDGELVARHQASFAKARGQAISPSRGAAADRRSAIRFGPS